MIPRKQGENVKVHHIHRETGDCFVAGPKMSRGVFFDRGSRKRLKVSRSARSIQSSSDGVSFAGKAMIKGAFSHGNQTDEQAAQTRSILSDGGFAEMFLRFVSGTIQRWFSGCVVFGRERRKGEADLLGMIGVICQRRIKGPRGRRPVHNEGSGVARGKKGARKWR